MSELQSDYEIVIEPSGNWLQVRWRELWEYRDLLILLIQRDFISRYKQTLLGPVWFILQPVLTTAVFVIIFGKVAGIPTDGIPQPLFYLCGLLAWQYFAQNITTGSATFVNNAGLFGKVWFPRLIVPISIVLSNLVAFGLQLIPFGLVLMYYWLAFGDLGEVRITPAAFLLIFPLAQTALLSLGVSLWMAASTARFRDLIHFNQYLVQIWMFATPIVYPLSKVKKEWEWIIWLNPMSVPTEAFRWCLLGKGTLHPLDVIVSVVVTLVLLVSGVLVYQRVERTVVDAV